MVTLNVDKRSFEYLRAQAEDLVTTEPSKTLLMCFPRLVLSHLPVAQATNHLTDFDLEGSISLGIWESTLLYEIVCKLQPRQALEIGSYVGWGSAHIVKALGQDAKLTCVDPFVEGKHVVNNGLSPTTLEAIKERFLENIRLAGVESRIDLICGHSPDALAQVADKQFDMAIIDGWHYHKQPIRDVEGVAPLMTKHGVIVLHDLWIADVQEAAAWLEAKGWQVHNLETETQMGVAWRGKMPRSVNHVIGYNKTR